MKTTTDFKTFRARINYAKRLDKDAAFAETEGAEGDFPGTAWAMNEIGHDFFRNSRGKCYAVFVDPLDAEKEFSLCCGDADPEVE